MNFRSMRICALVGLAAGGLTLASARTAEGQAAQDWGFGTDVGLLAGTIDGTALAIRFNADFFVSEAFSLSPMLMFTPTGDLSEQAGAGLFRYHIHVPDYAVDIIPFSGVGFVRASFDQETVGGGTEEVDDSALYFPLGVTAGAEVGPSIYLTGTVIANIHGLEFERPVTAGGTLLEKDGGSVALLVGFQYRPN
jgi:hypothetical protein